MLISLGAHLWKWSRVLWQIEYSASVVLLLLGSFIAGRNNSSARSSFFSSSTVGTWFDGAFSHISVRAQTISVLVRSFLRHLARSSIHTRGCFCKKCNPDEFTSKITLSNYTMVPKKWRRWYRRPNLWKRIISLDMNLTKKVTVAKAPQFWIRTTMIFLFRNLKTIKKFKKY